MRLKTVANNWLLLLICIILSSCTLSVEETFIPDSPQGGGGTDQGGEPDNPGGAADSPLDTVHDAQYYLDFMLGLVGDGSDGLKPGDQFEVIADSYVDSASGMRISGKFDAHVADDNTLSVNEAILLVDDSYVVVDNGVVQTGGLSLDTINQIATSWVDKLVQNQWSLDTDDYYCYERACEAIVQVEDPAGILTQYSVDFLFVREKVERDYSDYRSATRMRMEGGMPVWVEALRESRHFSTRITSSKIGASVAGDFSLSMAEGPQLVPSGNFTYDLLVAKYGDMSEGFKAGDSVKAVVTKGTGTSVYGSFTANFIAGDALYVDNAMVSIGGTDVVVIDDVVVDGDLEIEDVRAKLLELCNKVQSEGFEDDGNYFLFTRSFTEPLYVTALYDDEWLLRWLPVDSFVITREIRDTGMTSSRLAVQFSLSDPAGTVIALEAEQDIDNILASLDVTWYLNGSHTEGQEGALLSYGPYAKVSGDDFIDVLTEHYGTGLDGFRTGDKIYSILRNIYDDGAVGHFNATVTGASENSFTIRVDDAVLLIDDETIVVKDSYITSVSSMSEYELTQFIQRHLDYVMNNGMNVTSSDYIRLERKASGDEIYALDSLWNAAKFTVDSFQLVVESENRYSPRVAMKSSLSGAEMAEIEAETTGGWTDVTYFHLGSINEGTQGLVMYEGPSLVLNGQYYMDQLGPDGSGEMLNYEPGDTVHIELDDYWFEGSGSYVTGTVDALVTSSDITITSAYYTMDGCIVSISNDAVTLGGSGPLYGNWTESTYLNYTKRFITEAAVNLDNPQLVSFSQVRNLREPGTVVRLVDKDFIDREFTVAVCTLTRDRNGDERFECRLTCSTGTIALSAVNGALTDYSQY